MFFSLFLINNAFQYVKLNVLYFSYRAAFVLGILVVYLTAVLSNGKLCNVVSCR